MKSSLDNEAMQEIFLAFENVLKDSGIKDLYLQDFTLIHSPGPDSETSEAGDKFETLDIGMKSLSFFNRGEKCYQRICKRDSKGKIKCETKKISCDKLPN